MTTRRQVRTQLRLPVSLGRGMPALSADISDQGFCLEVLRPLQQGVPVEGFVLHGDKELRFHGAVAWVEPGDPQASHWSRVGIRFTAVSPGLRALLSLRQRR
jgi:hypothetical protein